ncbi:MAG: hypothetical protein ACYDC8_17320 [Gammaproteobacteria bacterium]
MKFSEILDRIATIGGILTIPMIVWRSMEQKAEAGRMFHVFGQQAAIAWDQAHKWDCLLEGPLIAFGIATVLVMTWQLIETQRIATARENAAREQRRQEEERQRAVQTSIHSSLVEAATTSLSLFESMPRYLLTAEEFLDQAERDFKEGVFSPFWDSIEKVTLQLGAFNDGVQTITINSRKHTELAKIFKARAPRFPIDVESVRGMVAATTTSERMRFIVRKAQAQPTFAQIYEQRRTNQLLVAGFTSLATALDGMGQRISSSIESLGSQISEMSSAMENSFSALGESVEALHSTTKQNASDLEQRHNRALEILDNIQRRRIPYPRQPLDGAY